jgi:hypothetical protein
MFPPSPVDDRSPTISRSASVQSRATNLASYFDFENPPQPQSSVSIPDNSFSQAGSGPTTNDNRSTKEGECLSKNAVENGGASGEDEYSRGRAINDL